jgi:hypothetical protein
VREVIRDIRGGSHKSALASSRGKGMHVSMGVARVVSPHEVMVAGETLRGDAFVIASGIKADVPDIEGLDMGPGIPAEDLPRVFDRFYRGDPSRTRASGNTGLGLAIARAIVQAHGGTIEAQSPPGSGARFTILLPAEQPHDSPARKEPQPLAAKTEARTVST